MRTGIDLLRDLAEIGRLAQDVETEEAKLRWLMRLGCLCAEVDDYLAAYDGTKAKVAS